MPFSLHHSGNSESNSEFYAYVPSSIDSLVSPPVIAFLHGGGERGHDPANALRGGVDAIFQHLELPAIVVFPQCSDQFRAFYGAMETKVLNTIDFALQKFRGDPRRVYLIGFSMGASSSLYLAARHPQTFAALAPIAVGITWPGWAEVPPNMPKDCHTRQLFSDMFVSETRAQFIAEKIKHIPCWFLHGTQDNACPVTDSRELAAELRHLGASPKLTEFEELGHDCLARALMQDGLFDWLLSQHLPAERALA